MSYLQKFLFIEQVGLSKHFNVGSLWLPVMGIAFCEAFEEQGNVVIDSGAQRPLRRPLKIHLFNHKNLHQAQAS